MGVTRVQSRGRRAPPASPRPHGSGRPGAISPRRRAMSSTRARASGRRHRRRCMRGRRGPRGHVRRGPSEGPARRERHQALHPARDHRGGDPGVRLVPASPGGCAPDERCGEQTTCTLPREAAEVDPPATSPVARAGPPRGRAQATVGGAATGSRASCVAPSTAVPLSTRAAPAPCARAARHVREPTRLRRARPPPHPPPPTPPEVADLPAPGRVGRTGRTGRGRWQPRAAR